MGSKQKATDFMAIVKKSLRLVHIRITDMKEHTLIPPSPVLLPPTVSCREKSEICSAWSRMSRINDHSDVSCALLWLLLEDSSVTPHTSGCSKGSFPPGLFLTVYISVDPDFCCCRHLQDLCKIWVPDKRYRNEQTLMKYLPVTCQPALPCSASSHHTPAWLAQKAGSTQRCQVTSPVPKYLEHENRPQTRSSFP